MFINPHNLIYNGKDKTSRYAIDKREAVVTFDPSLK
jgi:hypothetical protein